MPPVPWMKYSQRHIASRAPMTQARPSLPGSENMVSSAHGLASGETLTQISAKLALTSANLFTFTDKAEMLTELRTAIRKEMMEVQRDLMALETRVEELETDRLMTMQSQQEADTATARQGSVLLELRQQVEDLDNRGGLNNIGIRGLPKTSMKSLLEMLTSLIA
ncbi:Hypothetical predicted protein [Pelobates cultripes]|uniref:Uncharacterized protein n=1 Tax=Pelobates cultripes TaxID=61616 RepID=A0AAD1WAM9_PELCU|nr:Hypothetical predicted protein [Pelobates cultripes]